jgi:hypothetical protein
MPQLHAAVACRNTAAGECMAKPLAALTCSIERVPTNRKELKNERCRFSRCVADFVSVRATAIQMRFRAGLESWVGREQGPVLQGQAVNADTGFDLTPEPQHSNQHDEPLWIEGAAALTVAPRVRELGGPEKLPKIGARLCHPLWVEFRGYQHEDANENWTGAQSRLLPREYSSE